MLVYNGETVLLWADVPEKEYNSRGFENYALLHEYGVDGKNTLTYKSAIKRIMRDGAMTKKYPGMKVDVCNYTLTSDDRLVSAGERKFNEYRKHPELLYDTVTGTTYANTDKGTAGNDRTKSLLVNSQEYWLSELTDKIGSGTLKIRVAPLAGVDDAGGDFISHPTDKGKSSVLLMHEVGHPVGKCGFKFSIKCIDSKVYQDYAEFRLRIVNIHDALFNTNVGTDALSIARDGVSEYKCSYINSAELNAKFKEIESKNIEFKVRISENSKRAANDSSYSVELINGEYIEDIFNSILNWYHNNIVSKLEEFEAKYSIPINIREYNGALYKNSLADITALNPEIWNEQRREIRREQDRQAEERRRVLEERKRKFIEDNGIPAPVALGNDNNIVADNSNDQSNDLADEIARLAIDLKDKTDSVTMQRLGGILNIDSNVVYSNISAKYSNAFLVGASNKLHNVLYIVSREHRAGLNKTLLLYNVHSEIPVEDDIEAHMDVSFITTVTDINKSDTETAYSLNIDLATCNVQFVNENVKLYPTSIAEGTQIRANCSGVKLIKNNLNGEYKSEVDDIAAKRISEIINYYIKYIKENLIDQVKSSVSHAEEATNKYIKYNRRREEYEATHDIFCKVVNKQDELENKRKEIVTNITKLEIKNEIPYLGIVGKLLNSSNGEIRRLKAKLASIDKEYDYLSYVITELNSRVGNRVFRHNLPESVKNDARYKEYQKTKDVKVFLKGL